ncbi:MAG: FHA domain-containing protein [Pyrinomonadaceae bacterium]|nr:FHA domain-containing protein [Pyrinomonadaceae bacterium]
MIEAKLTYPTPEGSKQVEIADGETTLGRGAVDVRFDDSSLSRHHATIHREADKIWITDENSTNGSFVNTNQINASGTILRDGDSIKLGNETFINISIVKIKPAKAASSTQTRSTKSSSYVLPVIIGIGAFLIIGATVFVVAWNFSGGNDNKQIASTTRDFDAKTPRVSKTIEADNSNESANVNSTAQIPVQVNSNQNSSQTIVISNANSAKVAEKVDDTSFDNSSGTVSQPIAPGKTYRQMSEDERRKFIEREATHVSQMIGKKSGDAITPEAITRIKVYVDGYSQRLRATRNDNCKMGSWVSSDLQSILERGQKAAPYVVKAFNEKGLAPQIGLYLAMIESEYCVCLNSNTGPLGMFQFTTATAKNFGYDWNIVKGANAANPDDRCIPEKSAPAAASYMYFLVTRYGTGAESVPLAIASYNSGEGGLSNNLATALDNAKQRERNFWTLALEADKLSSQFKKENIKYVPKFFAAAIIGENPPTFGVNISPLSSNTKL